MKKIVRLTEGQLYQLIEQTLFEGYSFSPEEMFSTQKRKAINETDMQKLLRPYNPHSFKNRVKQAWRGKTLREYFDEVIDYFDLQDLSDYQKKELYNWIVDQSQCGLISYSLPGTDLEAWLSHKGWIDPLKSYLSKPKP